MLEGRSLLAAELETVPGIDQAALEPPSLLLQDTTAQVDSARSLTAFNAEVLSDLGQFAAALADAGVKVLGPVSSDEVSRQKALFGAGQDSLPFTEDSQGGLYWEFPGGERLDGFQTLASISQISGIPLPADVISIQTNVGRLEWQFLTDEAPSTVENFLRYVNGGVDGEGFGGTIFHRSETGFVIQAGGFRPTSLTTTDIDEIRGEVDPIRRNYEHHIPTFSAISDERGPNSMSNVYGTYSMAKSSLGATSEYFFNLGDNSFLDAQGFTVFATDLDAFKEDGSPNPAATISVIETLMTRDVDPANDQSGDFSVFDDVPYTDADEMVVIESITGSGIVSGNVFDDLDQDGVKDNGEAGIAGVRVFSDANGNGVADADEYATVTDGDGNYSMLLTAGEHQVRQEVGLAEVGLAGYLHLVTIPSTSTVMVPIGGEASDTNFGNSEARSLGLFALALADSGVTFTGPAESQVVQRQLSLFAPSQDLVPYIEDPEASSKWVFPGGMELNGFQTLASLSQLSGIPLPSDVISIQTNVGRLEWQLLTSEAPNTVENFLRYVNGGVDGEGLLGTIFHRADEEFVVQGGGFRPTSLTTTDIDEIRGDFDSVLGKYEHHIPAYDPIPDERGAESRSNLFGTYAMAKNSAGATSEYFFNLGDNSFLDAQGFTVFAVDLDAQSENGSPNASSTMSLIESLMRKDVDPTNDGTPAFSVFDNVPYTAADEMVVIQSIVGSGLASGTVFEDLDQDGSKGGVEAGIAGVRVFSDANNNNLYDDNEQSVMTDAGGNYTLLLSAGQHTIRRESAAGFFQTSPVAPGEHFLTAGIGEQSGDLDFGLVELRYDFGDAPTASQSGFASDYPVTLAQNGARHLVGDLFFGGLVDREANGQPDSLAGQSGSGGDDGNHDADEDGITLIADVVSNPGSTNLASFAVEVSQSGRLDAWIDFNRDGDWEDDGEQIFASVEVSPGSQDPLSFLVPAGASPGNTAARFRLSSVGGLPPTGLADDGEVEDHLVAILDSSDMPNVAVRPLGSSTTVVAEGLNVQVRADANPLFRSLQSDLGSLQIEGGDAGNAFTLDYSGGNLSQTSLHVDGGEGVDTVHFVGGPSSLDLTSEAVVIKSVSTIDLGFAHANRLTIDTGIVQAFGSAPEPVSIGGGDGDVVVFADASDWRMGDAAMVGDRFVRTVQNVNDAGLAVDIDLPYAWHNLVLSGDVNNNGEVTSADALNIINELGRRLYSVAGTGELVAPSLVENWPGNYYDVNKDGKATSLDALRVINELGRVSSGEGEASGGQIEDLAITQLVSNLPSESRIDREGQAGVAATARALVVGAAADFPTSKPEGLREMVIQGREYQSRVRAVDEFLTAAIANGF